MRQKLPLDDAHHSVETSQNKHGDCQIDFDIDVWIRQDQDRFDGS